MYCQHPCTRVQNVSPAASLVSMRILTKPGPYLPGHPISSGLRRVPSFSNNKDPAFRLLSFIVISCSLSSLHSWTPQDHPRFLTLSLIVSCPFAHSSKSNPAFSLPYWHYYKVLAFLLKTSTPNKPITSC